MFNQGPLGDVKTVQTFYVQVKWASLEVEVNENHTCRQFYSYKTVLGEAFYPR